MIARTAGEIAAAVGGAVVAGPAARTATGASIDTRTLRAGDLFFAIAGERHDGHDFLAAAAERGAAVLVVHRDGAWPAGPAVVRVDDTTAALGRLGSDERTRRGAMRVVGITGSAGKTTTRALTGAALAAAFRTGTSAGNLNNHWGVPLSLLALAPDVETAVLEMGMNHLGEIAELARIARPDVGVITNVGTAHIGNLGSQEKIAEAKAELLYGLSADGVGVLHAGSPELGPHIARCGRRVVTFGFEEHADLVPQDVEGDLVRGSRFALNGIPVRLALWGRHAVLNATAALGVAMVLGVPLAAAAERLAGVEQPAGRGRILSLGGGLVVVDEVYNSNPSALAAVLLGAAAAPWTGRRVAVVGDMLELGADAPRYHREAGRSVAEQGFDALFAVGPLASETADGARAAGLAAVSAYPDAHAAAAAVPGALADGDLVVIKGSRGIALEAVREAVVAVRGGRAGA